MKKTININICGTSFVIDDDAYAMLSEYLDSLRKAYAHSGDPQDFMEDIEMRIAELLYARPAGRDAIVSIGEVEQIIHRMGRPEEIEDLEVETDDTTEEEKITMEEQIVPPPYVPPVKHILYRNPEGKMLGGVCSGLATFFDINVAWIRLLFIVLFLASFSLMFLLYIILWLVIPLARTPLQKIQLRGEQPTVENIGESVRNTYTETPQENQGCLAAFLKVVVAIMLIITLPALVLGGLVMVICLIVMFAMALGYPLGDGEFVFTLRILFMCVAIGIPLMAISYAGLNYKKDNKRVKTSWIIAFAIVWICSIVGTRICGNYLDRTNDNSLFEIYSSEVKSGNNETEAEQGMEEIVDAPGYRDGKKMETVKISVNRNGSKIVGVSVEKENSDKKADNDSTSKAELNIKVEEEKPADKKENATLPIKQ